MRERNTTSYCMTSTQHVRAPSHWKFRKMTFSQKYEIGFVLVSDDRMWCIQILSSSFGLYVAEGAPSPAYDMAVLANL
ncbi:hypothetical protein JTE90_017645 [Oedothorax gibbosus]|uniref:Uncharacterized protein n=1 Tax=Oedothorax gibbosus TaxID=931172 RepID=A0AAV6U849_9ARAC|nr:hypothetical protein JTE90_017645 [Oedothorax gibbosus]